MGNHKWLVDSHLEVSAVRDCDVSLAMEQTLELPVILDTMTLL